MKKVYSLENIKFYENVRPCIESWESIGRDINDEKPLFYGEGYAICTLYKEAYMFYKKLAFAYEAIKDLKANVKNGKYSEERAKELLEKVNCADASEEPEDMILFAENLDEYKKLYAEYGNDNNVGD